MIVLVSHVISRDNLIKGSCDYTGNSLLKQVTILASLVAVSTVLVEI